MTLKIKHIGLLAAIAALATAAAPAPSPQAAVAARQAGYKKMGAAMKALNEQLKSDAPAKAAMIGAAQILAVTARAQPGQFPAGSGPKPGLKTDALPTIWSNRAAFDAQMTKLLAETGKLLAVANSGNVAALRVQAKATGAVCSGCHRQFRADS